MRIGIEAHAAEHEGSGNCTYIRNLLLALKEADWDNEYIIYVTDKAHPFYERFRPAQKFQIKQLGAKNPFLRIPLFLARESCKDALDILHVQWHAPLLHKGKLVATIHDLSFLHIPESFSRSEVLRAKIVIRMTAKKADRIITGSMFSKNDIVKSYKMDAQKIAVVPYGISHRFKPELDETRTQKILDKYKVREPYILSVGRLNPRKNFLTLMRALSLLRKKKSFPHKVVIVGKADYKTQEILQLIKSMNLYQDVVFTGFVEETDLPYLYHRASVFVYPSLYEGVGLPVIEAMKSGTPVVASNTTSVKEMVGEAGIAVDPLDEVGISEAISVLLRDEELRRDYIEKGLKRGKEFSWEGHAERTIKVYEETLKN